MKSVLHRDVSSKSGVFSIHPATGERGDYFPYHTHAEVEQRMVRAQRGFAQWRVQEMDARVAVLRAMAAVLRQNAARYSEAITREMGKLAGEACAEIQKCAMLCEWYAEHGPAMLADESAAMDGATAYVSYLPLGTVLGIMPWNFPFWQVMRAAVPILLGGNGFMLKHARNVMGCAFLLEQAWLDAGLPVGVFSVIHVPSSQVEEVLGDARIAAVTLTGSGGAGAAVAAQAGKLCKKSVLELGGSDPFIVLADADIDAAVEAGIKARFSNAGQVCIAAKRFILEAPIAEEFTRKFVAKAKVLTVGDPMDAGTKLAPIAREDLRESLHQQVQTSLSQGAQLVCGGNKIAGAGFFYEPTVLGEVAPGMVAFDEEMFGPVAALTVAHDVEEAIRLANHSAYGLSANLWTRDVARAAAIARRLEVGGVFINGFSASDPRIPIGGVKQSGYGRELSHFGIREFTNAQAVVIRHA